jgi:hypothetical protein
MSAGTVTIRLDSSDASDDGLRRLAGWLRDEDDLRGCVRVTTEPVRPGQMGGLTDAVVVAMTSGTAAAIANSLFEWLMHRCEVRKVAVTVESADGKRIDLTCGNTDDAEELLRVCHDVLGENG